MKKAKDQEISQVLSVGEMAERSGVPVSALHFYEAKGLISAFRNNANQRRFPRGVLRRVALIKVAQTLGFSLEEIGAMFSHLPKGKAPGKADWQNLAKHWRGHLDLKIKQLTKLRQELDGCIGCGCLSMSACPLRNAKDKLAKKGPGPHLL